MHPSTHALSIATLSILADDCRPVLFLDPELEALHRAGRCSQTPALLPLLARRLTRAAFLVLNGAIARRAVL